MEDERSKTRVACLIIMQKAKHHCLPKMSKIKKGSRMFRGREKGCHAVLCIIEGEAYRRKVEGQRRAEKNSSQA